jgi:nucleoside-triphosphatase THEP1
MKTIFIISGPVHSGKTSKLLSWLEEQKSVSGILAPIVKGKRYLLDITTGDKRALEIDNSEYENNIIEVGKYKFDNTVFKWGCKVIIDTIGKSYDWIIIDEFGPLELNGKGLAPAIDKIFSGEFELDNTDFIIVVRENMVKDFLMHNNLARADVNEFNFPD